MNYSSTLTVKRIIISLLIYCLIPSIRSVVYFLTGNDTISYTMALNLAACLLIIYDWNLFGIHWNRFKKRKADGILYTAIGFALIGLWVWFNQSFLKGFALLPEPNTEIRYMFALPTILLAFSYCQAAIVNISFKCLTDHMDIRSREVLMILLSGFLFGIFYTIAFAPFSLTLWVRTYLYDVILICILSYLYNQSSSFIPGILSYGTVLLILEIIQLRALL